MRIALIALLAAGAATAASQDRNVPDFEAVHVSAGIHATIERGPKKAIHLEASDELLAALETKVEDGELHIGFQQDSDRRGFRGGEVKVTIQAPSVRSVGASGGSYVRATIVRSDRSALEASGGSELHIRGVDTADLRVRGSGGSIVEVDGRADNVDAQLSGGSHLEGKELSARDVDIEGSGGSEGVLRASDSVHGALSGGSRLHVRGRPKTRVASSGGSGVDIDD